MILQRTVQGYRGKGINQKRWEDIIPECRVVGLSEALRKAEDREEWRKVVAQSPLMPQPSFRPRDELASEYTLRNTIGVKLQ